MRGVLNSMFQLNITIGIFCANIVNFVVGYLEGSLSWRIALLGAGIPASMLTLGGLLLVESPISMIERGKHVEGRAILEKVRGTNNVDLEFEEMVRACEIAKFIHPFSLSLGWHCSCGNNQARTQLSYSNL